MKHNAEQNPFIWWYLAGFFLILALPILNLPPYFFPADWGKAIVFRSAMSLMLLLFLWQWVFRRTQLRLPDLRHRPIAWGIATLAGVFVLATAFSADPYFSLWGSPERGGGLVNFLCYMMCGLLAFLLLDQKGWRLCWNVALGSGALVSLIGFIQFFNLMPGVFVPAPGRPPSTLGNPIFLGMYALILLFVALWLGLQEDRKPWKIAYFTLAALFLATIAMAGSRAAYLGLVIGGIWFLISYPKKFPKAKSLLAAGAVLMLTLVALSSFNVSLPGPLARNRAANDVYSRLSVPLFLHDARFSAWQTALKAISQRPLLGWGPENFSIAFDHNYNPQLPYLASGNDDWWDRAHSIVFDVTTDTGILGLLAYTALFGAALWQLQRVKRDGNHRLAIAAHGVQALLVGYLVSNLFSFDSYSTYLLSFFTIGYGLFLRQELQAEKTLPVPAPRRAPGWKKAAWVATSLCVAVFLWQFNLKPLQVNGAIVRADAAQTGTNCKQGVQLMENAMATHTFIDAYARLKYVDVMRSCAGVYPDQNAAYSKRGAEILKETVAIQPTYTRAWILLGAFTTAQASGTQDAAQKADLLGQAQTDFSKARQLSPNHQETFIEESRRDIVAADYQALQNDVSACLSIFPQSGDCHFLAALSAIYHDNLTQSDREISAAANDGFRTDTIDAYSQLANAHSTATDYPQLADDYLQLIRRAPDVAQYHASLAFAYAKMGQYEKAREQAAIFLQLMPGAKAEVSAFLATLPQ